MHTKGKCYRKTQTASLRAGDKETASQKVQFAIPPNKQSCEKRHLILAYSEGASDYRF